MQLNSLDSTHPLRDEEMDSNCKLKAIQSPTEEQFEVNEYNIVSASAENKETISLSNCSAVDIEMYKQNS